MQQFDDQLRELIVGDYRPAFLHEEAGLMAATNENGTQYFNKAYINYLQARYPEYSGYSYKLLGCGTYGILLVEDTKPVALLMSLDKRRVT